MATDNKEPQFLMYKDKPLVRCKNTIYYGDMNDPYVIMLQIMNYEIIYNQDWEDGEEIEIYE